MFLRFVRLGSAVALAATAVGSASAQQVPQDENVTVTGQREVPQSHARRFVRQVMTTVDGQFPRFVDPVCPMVVGLPERYAQVVLDRIRSVAADADVRLDKPRCSPNVLVIIAADGDRLVKDMRSQVPTIFGSLSPGDIRKVMRQGPVHVWSGVQLRNEDGETAGGGAGLNSESAAAVINVKTASIIEMSTQQATVFAVMVVDDDAIMGKTLTQLADYAAMRTLGGARVPESGKAADTILTLFDASAVAPPHLTSFDRSYLKGLYKSRPLGRGMVQAGQIARTIVKDAEERVASD
jgi:hypothetical protein